MTKEALDLIDGDLHAANVDLKTMEDSVLRHLSGARVGPVLETIERLKAMGVWVEVTTLVVPGLNDRPEQLAAVARFLAGIDPTIPWHVSRFHPDYKMKDIPATPAETLAMACRVGRDEGLEYVYSGNLWGDERESTYCPGCGEVVIGRVGFAVTEQHMDQGRCGYCGRPIAGRWSP